MAEFNCFIAGKMRCNNSKCEVIPSVILALASSGAKGKGHDLINDEILRPRNDGTN